MKTNEDGSRLIEVGDLVRPNLSRQPDGFFSSGGRYDFAVVVSLEPFLMVSEWGDMLWMWWKLEDVFWYDHFRRIAFDLVRQRIEKEDKQTQKHCQEFMSLDRP